MTKHTVEAALLALSARDQDYATIENGVGFNGRDTGFGNSLAKQVAAGKNLSPKQYGTAYRMLRTYRVQLSGYGIDYDLIPTPDQVHPNTAPKETAKTVDFRGGFFVFQFSYDPNLKDELKDAITGRRWDADNKVWIAPVESASLVGKFALKFGFKVTPEALKVIGNAVPQKSKPTRNEAWESSWATDADLDIVLGTEDSPKELLGFQRAGVRYALDQMEDGKGILIGDEMGLGKTPQSAAILKLKESYPVLVGMPRVVWLKWAKELMEWTPGLKVVLLGGRIVTPKTRKIAERFDAEIIKLGQPVPEADVYLCKYSVLHKWVKPKSRKVGNSKHQKSWYATGALKDLKVEAVVWDEVHLLKSETAQRTQAALGLTGTAKPRVRLALSGTAMPNRHQELLSILKLLNRLGDVAKNEWDFLNYFCNPNGYGIKGQFGFEWNGSPNGEELNRRMRSKFYSQHEKLDRIIDGFEVPGVQPDLPAIIPDQVPADLDDYTRYDEVAVRLDDAKHRYSDAMRTLERAVGDNRTKWQAICKKLENEVGVLSNEARKVIGEEKIPFDIEWIENWLESSTGKMIVFGWHREVNESIANHFNAPIIYGGTSESERQEAEDRFNDDPDCRLLVGQIAAAGVGWNGTAADTITFVEFSYVWSDMTQAIGRAYGRISDMHGVNVNYLYAPGTIDDHVIDDILEDKKKVQTVSVGGA